MGMIQPLKYHIYEDLYKQKHQGIPKCDKAKNFLKVVEEQFVSSDKAMVSTLMKKLSGMKHNNSINVHEYIMEMRDVVAQLKSPKIDIFESFLVYLIMNSLLPKECNPFKISYNTYKDKWTVTELLTMWVQEEERLKYEKIKLLISQLMMRQITRSLRLVLRERKTRCQSGAMNLSAFFTRKKGT